MPIQQNPAESQVVPQVCIEWIFSALAAANLPKFIAFSRRMRAANSQDFVRLSLRYLGSHELDEAGRWVSHFLSTVPDYCGFLLDPSVLTVNQAELAAKILRAGDGRFTAKMVQAFQEEIGCEALDRTLRILEVTGGRAPLIPCLMTLTGHPDERIRSKAVKALCELRPHFALVKRQLESEDARVRANAIEALWQVPGEEAAHIFFLGQNDPHHRVAVNALLGFYYQNDASALNRLHKLASHHSGFFRRGAMWAIDRLRDTSSIPALQKLAVASPYVTLREKAKQILTEMIVNAAPEGESSASPDGEHTRNLAAAESDRSSTLGFANESVKQRRFDAPEFRSL